MAGSGTSDTDYDCYDTGSSKGTESDDEGCFLDYGFQPQIAPSCQFLPGSVQLGFDEDIDRFAQVGNKAADAAGVVIRKYFRKSFEIHEKEDLSPVTIADRAAEESMVPVILENFPSHAIYGEENGWRCKEKTADYVWVLDPIDGTKSFITGKPVFGTLIALLHKGIPESRRAREEGEQRRRDRDRDRRHRHRDRYREKYRRYPTRALAPLMLEDYRKVMVDRRGEKELFSSDDIIECMKKGLRALDRSC